MRGWRRPLAVFCVALIAFTVLAPAAGTGDVLAFLMPVWQEFQPDFVIVASTDSTPSPEQPVSHRSPGASRAPPAAPSA